MKGTILLLYFAFIVTTAHAQIAVQIWTNRYNGPANDRDGASAIALDDSGNVIVTGYSATSTNVDFPNYDYVTIMYSSAGVPLWTNRYNGPPNSHDVATAMAVDRDGNILVTGYSHGFATHTDYATIKYSNAGVPLWTNRYDEPGHTWPGNTFDQPSAIAVNTNGQIFVTGYSLASGGGEFAYATVAYSSTGVQLWTRGYKGAGTSTHVATAITVGGNGNVLVTGYSGGTNGHRDYATIAYSGAGVPLWTNRYDGPGNGEDVAVAVAVDSHNTVFVTGHSVATNGYSDYATVAYSGSGVPLWTSRYDGPGNASDSANAITVDKDGNIVVTGSSASTNTSPFNDDYVTIKYSNAGVPLWTNRYGGPANDFDTAQAVAVDSSGRVFVTGYAETESHRDCVTIAYSGEGAPLWTNRYDGSATNDDYGYAIAADNSGNVCVTGQSNDSNGYSDFVTIKYATISVVPIRLEVQKINSQLLLSWTNSNFRLQSAPAITGSFTNIPNATSPYTNPIIGPQQFFRLISN